MASYYGNESPTIVLNDPLDPTNCPLHIQKMTGRMSFTMDEDGNYPVDAPPCHCILGNRKNTDIPLTDALAIQENTK